MRFSLGDVIWGRIVRRASNSALRGTVAVWAAGAFSADIDGHLTT
jgi:hypothetical protein